MLIHTNFGTAIMMISCNDRLLNTMFGIVVWKPLFIYQLGSDEVERLFACVRCLSHDSHCDCLQVKERLQISRNLGAIYARHPELASHQSYRLSVSRGLDHSNPKHWLKDQRPSEVDLKYTWRTGKIRAEALLSHTKWFKPTASLAADPNITIMRPNGNYVGLTIEDEEEDDDENDEENVGMAAPDDTIQVTEGNDILSEIETSIHETEKKSSKEIHEVKIPRKK